MLVDQFQKPFYRKKNKCQTLLVVAVSSKICLFTEIYAKQLLSSKEMSKLVKAQKTQNN